MGIGNDRDPDGYFTGFHEWAPRFWTSLGVDAQSASIEPVIPSDDAIKGASNFLRGRIAEGLKDESTGALYEWDTKLTKFHGIYQQDDRDLREHRALKGMEKAFSFMIRVRLPGGVSTAAQWLAIDEIANTHANSTIKITTRQAFQFHGVVKKNLKATIQEINRGLMGTLNLLRYNRRVWRRQP
jgi:sulfite reductase (NADPH) hemoprotein beta-component